MLKLEKLTLDEVLDYLNENFRDILKEIDRMPVYVTFAHSERTKYYTIIYKTKEVELTGYKTKSKAKLCAFTYNVLVEYNEDMAEDCLEKIDELLP